ncbi:MAG: hypothetical protein IPG89_08195 [Bacteroidetes bacterium]|nr:hypothetical protein [Bacteroidota bacterium]
MNKKRQTEYEKKEQLLKIQKRLEEIYHYGTPFVYKNLEEALVAMERENYLRELLKDKVEEPGLSYRDMRLQKVKWNRHFIWKNISPYKSMGYTSTYLLNYIINLTINYN